MAAPKAAHVKKAPANVQTNKVSYDPPPMVETTGHQRPDPGTIHELARRRDYPMSTAS